VFVEEATWLRRVLSDLPSGAGARVLDIGSQTLEFRTIVQPHIDREIFAPLRERRAAVAHLDAQAAAGVDIVADITSGQFSLEPHPPFDIVICANLLEHVRDRAATIRRLEAATAGHLVVTVPGHFPYHEDPIDTMYRPTERQLAGDVVSIAPTLAPVLTATIQIVDPAWYLSRLSRCRRLVPRLRWRTSAAVFRRLAPAGE
jgi:SAM-dependent methyltransferase